MQGNRIMKLPYYEDGVRNIDTDTKPKDPCPHQQISLIEKVYLSILTHNVE